MDEKLKALLEAQDQHNKEHQALLAKGGDMTADDVVKVKDILAAMDARQKEIEAAKAVSDLQVRSKSHDNFLNQAPGALHILGSLGQQQAELQGLKGTVFPNGVQFLGFAPDGYMGIENHKSSIDFENISDINFKPNAFKAARLPEYKEAVKAYMRGGERSLTSEQVKVLNEGTDSAGGYLAPEEILNRLISRTATPTRVQNYVTRLQTSRDAVNIAKVNYSTDDLYTTGMRVTWTGEQPASGSAHRVTDPIFGNIKIPVYTAMMSIALSEDFLEDSAMDVIGWLTMKFGETADLLRDNMILNGSGIGQPSGILVNPGAANNPSVVVSGSAAAITADGLIDLTEAIPEQYDENSRLIFNKTNAGKAIRKLKDGEGRPLVSYGAGDFGLAAGRYKEVNGYPYNWSGFMPNEGASTYPLIFGDLLGYYQVDRVGMSVRVFNDSQYAELNQRLILGRIRFGGVTAEDWRLKIGQCHA